MHLDPTTTELLDKVLAEVGHDFMKMVCVTASGQVTFVAFSENEIGIMFADPTTPFTILENVWRAEKLGSKVNYAAFKAVRWIGEKSSAILVCHRNTSRSGE